MNQIEAFKETLAIAQERGMADCEFEIDEVNYWHLQDMLDRILQNPNGFSPSKLGRWLGWAQCAVVAGGYASLDDMKAINLKYSAQAHSDE